MRSSREDSSSRTEWVRKASGSPGPRENESLLWRVVVQRRLDHPRRVDGIPDADFEDSAAAAALEEAALLLSFLNSRRIIRSSKTPGQAAEFGLAKRRAECLAS